MSRQVFLDTSPRLQIANMIRAEINEILARYDVHSDAHERDVLIDAACVALAAKALSIGNCPANSPEIPDGWECPLNSPGCTKNCGSYGCGN